MANPNKRKGTAAENKAVTVFATQFRFCERRVQRGPEPEHNAETVAGREP